MKKRLLSMLLALVMTVMLLPNLTASAMTPQEGAEWALAQIGRWIDTDGQWGAQCVDLIVEYCRTNFGWNPQGSGNAEAYRTVKLQNSSWQRIKNTPDFIPQPGDIAIWNPAKSNGYYGHVAIVVSANINTLTTVDQNLAGSNNGSAAAKKTRNYSNFWGVIRPPFSSSSSDKAEPIHSSTAATVRNGFFTLKNAASGKYLNVYGGKDENGTAITMWEYDDSTDQQFNIAHQGGGKYKLYAACSDGGNHRVVTVSRVNGTIAAGQAVHLWNPNDHDAQRVYVVPLSDGTYVLELGSKDGYVLAPVNTTASKTNGAQLVLQKYTGTSYQKWKFCNNNGVETSPLGSYSVDSYKVNTNGVNLTMRSGAGTSYAKVASIPDGTTLQVTKVSGNWGYTTYGNHSGWVCLDYTVFDPTVTSIEIGSEPFAKEYFVGETLDITNMSVNVIYSNGAVKEIISGYSTKYDFSTPGTKTVTVTYSGKSTTFSVEVIEPSIEELSIASDATKTNYSVGETLDTTGLSLTAVYNDGSEKTITSGFTAEYDFSTAGTKTVTISFEGMTVSYEVNVEEAETPAETIGDVNLDGSVDINDAVLLFQHSMLPDVYPIEYAGSLDFTGDSVVDIADAVLLFQHSMLPDLYPLA